MADAEFRTEVQQSLERAFAEGHSVENASVELKTLRMASNVPLRRVKEAVVAAIVEKINVVEGDAGLQRKEIGAVIGRWGELIDRIGGVDPVETVSILQVNTHTLSCYSRVTNAYFQEHCASSTRMPLFGQILAALYQEDIVDEDDIRAWHSLGESKADVDNDNIQKCWMIGTKMIEQFDAQESSESESEVEKATPKIPAFVPKAMESEDESEESDNESSRANTEGTGTDGGESANEDASEEVSTTEGSSTEDEDSEEM
jgi:translation initiation factor eIF-2B subunit epsilon